MTINRVPGGVPIGGQFVQALHSEPDLSESETEAAEKSLTALFGGQTYEQTRQRLKHSIDAVDKQRRLVNGLMAEYRHHPRRAGSAHLERMALDQIGEEQTTLKKLSSDCADACELHAAASDEGCDDVVAISQYGGYFSKNVYNPTRLGDEERLRRVRAWTRHNAGTAHRAGFGTEAKPISNAEAEQKMPVGSQWQGIWIHTNRNGPDRVTITEANRRRFIGESGRLNGQTVYDRALFEDENGNLVALGRNGIPIQVIIRDTSQSTKSESTNRVAP